MTGHDIDTITSYHAHVYYDEASRATAERLRQRADTAFTVELGRWHDKPRGPHPVSMYQIAFGVDQFERFVPWLMLNHDGLVVLIHPNTGDDVADHTEHALWLGEKIELDIDVLRRVAAEESD